MKPIRRYNATLRNLEYRLRAFREQLPLYLEDAIRSKEDVIVSAIANDQLFRRGVNGQDVKIMEYRPYAPSTISKKRRKGQPYTRVTLRDTGAFHEAMHLVVDPEGFYITSDDYKRPFLAKRYGNSIFRLTDRNFTRIVRGHIRKELVKQIKKATRQ